MRTAVADRRAVLRGELLKVGRVMALDFGSARCGVAMSDPTGTIASPHPVVFKAATPSGLRRIAQLAREHQVEQIVLGLPIGLSGCETAQTRETRAFAERLRAAVELPVELYDERFTTRMAERDIDPRAHEDSRAAAHLLDGWLTERGGGPLGAAAETSADRPWDNRSQ
ncbi:MAG: Holliday junction resolvase RuvX [Patulibacter sp.]